MKNSKTPSQGYTILEVADLGTLHRQSKVWLSDIAFREEEAGFLKSLLQKHFVHFLAEEGIDTIGKISNELEQLADNDLKELQQRIEKHENYLARIIENPLLCEEEAYRQEHRSLDERFGNFHVDFLAVKRRIFGAAEQVLRIERIKALKK